ncbi:MAG TPA: hypothetical protein GX500_03400 [Firmicutes bacterium]|nr:hypothetical protein [Candidatus Fermentithermobacillaceae bacterium]
MSEPKALQLSGSLAGRLQACVGMPVLVYLRGVHGSLEHGIPEMPGDVPGPGMGSGFGPGTGSGFGPGVPCPGTGPGMGSGFGPSQGSGPGFGGGPGRPAWPGVSALDGVEAKRHLRGPCPEPRPPCPCPEPGMRMMTMVVQGVLSFVGADYIAVSVSSGRNMSGYREVAVPLNAIGMVICAGEVLM